MVNYKNLWFAKFGHDCDTKSSKEDQLSMFRQSGNVIVQIKNRIIRARMASEVSITGNRFLRSQRAIHEEHLRHLKCLWVIHPFSDVRKYWETTMLVVFMAVFITIPLDVASYSFPLKDNLNNNVRWKTFRFLTDLVCCVDVIINFFTGYVDEKNNQTVLELKKIAIHYATGFFVPDILSSIPFHMELFSFLDSFDSITAEGFFQYCSLLKVVRVPTFRKYSKRFTEEFNIPFIKYQMTLALIFYTLYFHLLACINMMFIGQSANLKHKVYTSVHPYNYYVFWPQMNSTRHVDFTEGYLMILRQSSYMATFAYLDDFIALSLPLWYFIVVWIVSKVMFFYLIARFMQVITISRSSIRKYQEMLRELKEYMMHKQLPMSLQQRLLNYYEFRFQRSYFRESEIMNTVSGQLKQDLILHNCRKVVERVEFFKTMPMDLITQIVSAMETEIYMVNDVIVKANTPGNCMYFIASGCVAAYTKGGIEFIHLTDGDYFGEYSLIHKCREREWNVIAIETCELYRFDYPDFLKIIVPHQDFLQKITVHAQERYEMLQFYEMRYHKER